MIFVEKCENEQLVNKIVFILDNINFLFVCLFSPRDNMLILICSSYGLGSTGSAGSSAIDRYYSFLDDISSPSGGIKRQSASTTSNYGLKSSTNSTTDHYSMPNRYSSRYSSSDHSAGSASSGASSSSGYSSSISSRYGSSTDYQPMSSRYSR